MLPFLQVLSIGLSIFVFFVYCHCLNKISFQFLVPCARRNWLTVGFWAHLISYRIVFACRPVGAYTTILRACIYCTSSQSDFVRRCDRICSSAALNSRSIQWMLHSTIGTTITETDTSPFARETASATDELRSTTRLPLRDDNAWSSSRSLLCLRNKVALNLEHSCAICWHIYIYSNIYIYKLLFIGLTLYVRRNARERDSKLESMLKLKVYKVKSVLGLLWKWN